MEFFKNIFSKLTKKNQYTRKETFKDSEHQTLLTPVETHHIAEGNTAEILSSTIEFQRPTKSGKILSKNKEFVIKCYTNNSNRDKVYNNWKLLHQLKFDTFKTYRKFEKTKILMTNLSSETQFCTSSNNLDDSIDADFLQENKLIQITNFEELLLSAIDILELAKQNNVNLGDDAYFFIGSKNKSKITGIKIIIGDLDFISKNFSNDVIQNMEISIKAFILYFVETKYRPIYFSALENKFKKLYN
jgi:hypothetical protein